MILTGFICFVLGGVVSEFVQSLLPVRICPYVHPLYFTNCITHLEQYKEFQFGDVVVR